MSTSAKPSHNGLPANAAVAGEFLTFTLGQEEYGVDILKVQEIRGYDAVTRLPDAPDYIKGVINLRGTIVPIIDMRVKFRLDAKVDATTVMIVLNVADRVVGMVVDSVSDVVQLSGEQIRPMPDVGTGIDRRYLTGIGALDERMLILLDIEGLMTSSEMGLVADEAAAQAA
ncbi:chemotaxis protein CheW [Thermomonas haemolytica]|uniref:Chemotaxis protein CheW n=1 Tax=Thermomonas haemolytica TaxID=141949 RepID=A0A4V2V210_9GAMM|nr:chemotaxis protein CheW [Thermomonas haemolytica]TCT23242.1 purine-binding chemotaxis protein CheW [Thermomonas haemolytica]TNY29601.1 chemotaxis protein CheW [Thermomonas haemolytica]